MKLDEDALEAARRTCYERPTPSSLDDSLRKIVTAYLAAMRAKGWALRPREPSDAMFMSAWRGGTSPLDIWRAMWVAAEED